MAEDDPRTDVANKLTKTVGALVIYYAMLEHWIDGMVFCTFDHVEGAKLLRRQHPFNGKDEIDFLKESFDDLAALVSFRAEGLDLIAKIEPLADFRHDIVHGHVRKINYETAEMEFSRVVKGDDKKPLRRSLTIGAENLFLKGREILALIDPAMRLTHRLVAAFDPNYKREHASGSLGWTLASVLPIIKKIGD